MSMIFQLRSAQAPLAAGRPSLDDTATLREGRSWSNALKQATKFILSWQERARQRHHLESLSDHMLRDIGLTRADVLAEVTKPFWQR